MATPLTAAAAAGGGGGLHQQSARKYDLKSLGTAWS